MEQSRFAIKHQSLIWTLLIILALALMAITVAYTLRSDTAYRPRVQAFLVGDQPMVVLHAKPEASSGIAGLLTRERWVNVLEYDPGSNPDWARIESGEESGWVPLDRLRIEN
ncbi:MAG: hypothetical protein P8X64_03085 [Anaerolineales bacterium]|jgi:hypothetical protein